MSRKSGEKAAFVTTEGVHAPVVTMMGLAVAPAKFQEIMMTVRERERERAGAEQIHPYLDNFITAADDYEEHLEGIRIQFKALR